MLYFIHLQSKIVKLDSREKRFFLIIVFATVSQLCAYIFSNLINNQSIAVRLENVGMFVDFTYEKDLNA